VNEGAIFADRADYYNHFFALSEKMCFAHRRLLALQLHPWSGETL